MTWFSTINWQIFWQPERLFLVKPPADWPLEWWYIALIALNLVLALTSLIFGKRLHPRLREAMSVFGWSNLIVMGILYFFRVQRIPYLGMDLIRTIHELSILIWGIFLVRGMRSTITKQKTQELVEARRSKYLPKPKNLS